MVERLKHAIEKARAQRRSEPEPAPSQVERGPGEVRQARPTQEAQLWASLREVTLRQPHMSERRIVSHDKSDPAHIAFDLLRTRMLKAFRDNGWNRLAITSPRKGCGKTLVAANLALSFARQPDLKTLLVDMDLKAPQLSRVFGVENAAPLAWFLTGQSPIEVALRRYGDNLAIGMNSERVRDSSELIHDDMTSKVLAGAVARLKPDIAIFDMPPVLVSDDVIAFLSHVDCVLLVAAAGETPPKEIEDCERMFAGHTNFLGVILNKAENSNLGQGYEYV